MNKILEALVLSAAKALDLGVVGVDAERAREWGVPVGKFVREGEVIPGHSKKARTTGYYCPYSAWRPASGKCLFVDRVEHGDGASHYQVFLLSEDTTGYGSFAGQNNAFSLSEIKAYLRGVADGADLIPKPRKGRR